jgi:hypothetical protein
MSAWVSAAPVIGTGSLDGFAAAALMSVVGAMAITAPRRSWRPSAARGGAQADESFGAAAERLARPEEFGTPGKGRSAGGRYGRAEGGYRSRHRRGDPIPGQAPRDGVSPGIVFADAQLALVPFASARRLEARRPPRHAAPSVGLGGRISGFGSRMTGLFATRALASGARG